VVGSPWSAHPEDAIVALRRAEETGSAKDIKQARALLMKLKPAQRRSALATLADWWGRIDDISGFDLSDDGSVTITLSTAVVAAGTGAGRSRGRTPAPALCYCCSNFSIFWVGSTTHM
jgi:hypothetical protein